MTGRGYSEPGHHSAIRIQQSAIRNHLETQAQTKSEFARSGRRECAGAQRAKNLSEVRAIHVPIRVAEMGRVGRVECLGTELQVGLRTEFERSKQAQVETANARPSHRVAPDVAEAHLRHALERRRVEVRAVTADFPEV